MRGRREAGEREERREREEEEERVDASVRDVSGGFACVSAGG